jgi:transcription antitermination factor NusG
VRILSGLFENFTGKVVAIDSATQRLQVVVPMLKRETTVELAYDEVVRTDE